MADDVQAFQNVANVMAIPNCPPYGQLTQYGYGLDAATQEAAKEYARVQQSVLVLQQAAQIRADRVLMEAIRKYLREEQAKISHLMDGIDG